MTAAEHRALCRAMGTFLDAEHHDTSKVNDNDVLRPTGTLNHKTDPPRPVTWLIRPDDVGVATHSPEMLAGLLSLTWPIVEYEEANATLEPVTATVTQARLDGLVRAVRGADAKDGNNALHWAGCRLGEIYGTDSEAAADAIEMLVEAYLGRDSSRHTRTEAEATIRSGMRKTATATAIEIEIVEAAPVTPSLPADIERCPMHAQALKWDCPLCLVVRPQIERYGRARAVLREAQADADPNAWRSVDLSLAPDLPEPTMMTAEPWEGGDEPLSLLRIGLIGAVHGKSGGAKTTLVHLAGAQEVRKGGLYLVVDHEMGESLTKDALLELGLSRDELHEAVMYVDDPPAISEMYFEDFMADLVTREDATGRRLALGNWDSLSRAMGKVPGASTNDELQVNAWYDSLPRRVLRQRPESSQVTVDHPGRKDGADAIGSHAKGAGPDWRMWVKSVQPFDFVTRTGRSTLVIPKFRGNRTVPLHAEVAETVVLDGAFRLRRIKPSSKHEVGVDLGTAMGRTKWEIEMIEALREAGTDGLLGSSLTGGGEYNDVRKDVLEKLFERRMVWRRKSGNGWRYWLAEFAPGDAECLIG